VRTNDDKRRAVLRMLTDPEWRQWPLRKIEKHCGVSIGLVQSTAWRIFACTSLGLECPLIVYTDLDRSLCKFLGLGACRTWTGSLRLYAMARP
jgi:hypothetical protein